MAASMIRNLEAKTGKDLPSSRLQKHGQIVKLLKQEQGVTTASPT